MNQGSLASLLSSFDALITYTPLGAEPRFQELMALEEKAVYEIPPHAHLDPSAELARAQAVVDDRVTAILLPGRYFDASGTRHGRGGGWYDRFLAEAPPAWTRIGLCFNDQFEEAPLMRQAWDQPVDYVVVVPRAAGDPVIYETRARS